MHFKGLIFFWIFVLHFPENRGGVRPECKKCYTFFFLMKASLIIPFCGRISLELGDISGKSLACKMSDQAERTLGVWRRKLVGTPGQHHPPPVRDDYINNYHDMLISEKIQRKEICSNGPNLCMTPDICVMKG